MNSWAAQIQGLTFLVALVSAGPVSALAAEPVDLRAMEKVWHGCVRAAYEQCSRAGRERNALDECKPHEDAYVAALMAARPGYADAAVSGWVRTWAAYVSFVVDPVKAWFEALRR